MTTIEQTMDQVLDVLLLLEGGIFTSTWGRVLSSLASVIHNEDVPVGDTRYHQVSAAVLRLEVIGLVTVDRAYRDEAQKANIITAIRLA